MSQILQFAHARFTFAVSSFTSEFVKREDDRAVLRMLCAMALRLCILAEEKTEEESNKRYLKRRIKNLHNAQMSLQHEKMQLRDGTVAYDFYVPAHVSGKAASDAEYHARHDLYHSVFESISNMADVLYNPRNHSSMYEDAVFDPAREIAKEFLQTRFGAMQPDRKMWRDIRDACERMINGWDQWNRLSVEFTTTRRPYEPDPVEAKLQNEQWEPKQLSDFFKILAEKRNGKS